MSPEVPPFRIESMRRSGVDFAIALAAAEGWNPGVHDALAFHAADPDGFLVGLLDGRPIACISAVRYPDAFGFIGLYIVVPEQRGNGYGIRLWNAAMARLRGCNVGLDGVPAQQENYRRSGFRSAYRNIRFELNVAPPAGRSEGIVDGGRVAFRELAAFDRTVFPSARDAFLRAWLDQPESAGLAAVATDGTLAGYGVVRRCRHGSKVGPLFATDAVVAEQLFLALCAQPAAALPVYLDVPDVNAAALALARDHGMREVFGTARMYTGGTPTMALDRVFGVTTFELG